jgi:catechol-2,3-dioxygenase
MNGDLHDKQRIVQRFGQQAYRLVIGHGQQAMVSFKKQPVALGAYHFAFRQPGQRRDLAKSLGRRALNGGQEGMSLSSVRRNVAAAVIVLVFITSA